MVPQMRLFLAQHGKKTGPFSLWDVRGQLERGEISPDTLGWHDGCPTWLPLRDLPGLGWRGEAGPEKPEKPVPAAVADDPKPDFADEPAGPLPPTPTVDKATIDNAVPAGAGEALPGVPEEALALDWSAAPRPWSRFWARWFDFSLWLLIVALSLKPFHVGFDRFLLEMPVQVAALLLMLAAEAACLAAAGTTPGKALLGLRVVAAHGGPVPYRAALARSALVFAAGNALYSVVCVFAWMFHYVALAKRGAPFWDRLLGTGVVAMPFDPRRVVIFAGLFLAIQFALQAAVGEETRVVLERIMQGGASQPENLLEIERPGVRVD
jgi:uncharacterized RDD family membrane protein YckC